MQNKTTGEMNSIPEELYDKLEAENIENEMKRVITKVNPVFKVGEILDIKGGRFMIKTIGKEGMFLKGIPSVEQG